MRALVFTGPGQAEVKDVPPPVAADGQVVVDVDRVGICGTDLELFTGEMSYLHSGVTTYPLRPGHEWAGVVTAIGDDVDNSWLGHRVTGDTMIGCGNCRRCRTGFHHVCQGRHELGIRDGLPGALAEQVAVPVRSLQYLPDNVDGQLGALVEPGGNALRAVRAAALASGERLLVFGTGTIGLLAAMLARALGADVHLLGREPDQLNLAATLGFTGRWTRDTLPAGPWDAVIDATNASEMPALAVDLVEPGRRVVFIGLAGTPSLVDSRDIALKDITAVGILGGSDGLAGAIEAYAAAAVDPRPLVAITIGLEDVADALAAALAGARPAGAGPGPKIHVDPGR
jgi:2-desacetyl-2-hydroxyethyl bacteriochlorophyllide A dehydrogenase